MLGILCGLKNEAKIADRMPVVLVGCSAARPERGWALAQQMIDKGATRLVSFGLCGGISSDLIAGDLVLGASVMTAKDAWEADTTWNRQLVDRLPNVMCIPVWGSDHVAARVEDKALIYRRTGCLALDMESHIVAQMAHEHGIPFNVVRAVCDPYDMALPAAARVPLKEDGSVDYRAVFDVLKKQPAQLPDLARLGLATARAMRSLKVAVSAMGELE